ncbi:hypothetical protein Q5P01_010515 [Channa striata]|uniref:Uncharacterized protein n=1 Tax=Channa striata TaxID=64152 RepID=A0AA88N343_CHASR|nr:hypothetical protein Q5P01_010515 [Channa striata]
MSTYTSSDSLVQQFLASRLQASIKTQTPRHVLGPPPAQGLSLRAAPFLVTLLLAPVPHSFARDPTAKASA